METNKEFAEDIFLGIGFLFVSFFSGWRTILYFEPFGSGKVITAFYTLLFTSSFLRAVWFLIPSKVLECTYIPVSVFAYTGKCWIGIFSSQILLSFGSLCLYSVFMLLVSFWSHMLYKIDSDETIRPKTISDLTNNPTRTRRGPMETFVIVMVVFSLIDSLNVIFFLLRFYDSNTMILYDSIVFSLISAAMIIGISSFSSRIRIVLTAIGVINANSTKPQVRRILAVTVAINMFLLLQFITEIYITFLYIESYRENKYLSLSVSHHSWDKYIQVKHWSEFCVMILLLIISTSISNTSNASNSNNNYNASRTRKLKTRRIKELNTRRGTRSNPDNEFDNRDSFSDSEMIPLTIRDTPTMYSV